MKKLFWIAIASLCFGACVIIQPDEEIIDSGEEDVEIVMTKVKLSLYKTSFAVDAKDASLGKMIVNEFSTAFQNGCFTEAKLSMKCESNNNEYKFDWTVGDDEEFSLPVGRAVFSYNSNHISTTDYSKAKIIINGKVDLKKGIVNKVQLVPSIDRALVVVADGRIGGISISREGSEESYPFFDYGGMLYAFVDEKFLEEDLEKARISIVNANGERWKSYYLKDLTFEKGVCYVISDVFDLVDAADSNPDDPDIVPLPEADYPEAPAGCFNLSAYGTANCYALRYDSNSFDQYCIRADVKGCGPDKTNLDDGCYAEVLWETNNLTSSVKPVVSDVCLVGKYIVFSLTYRGNAVIALKDQSGRVLWSWHIWSSLRNANETYVLWNGTKKVMDRNIGAMNGTGSSAYGLMFQWGRKDPILPQLNTGTVYSSSNSWLWSSRPYSETSTVNYSIQVPMTFMCSNSNGDWCDDDNSQRLWDKKKTIYDPCPVGWKVPDTGLNGSDYGFALDFYGWKSYGSYPGAFLYYGFSSPQSWFPAQGLINGQSGEFDMVAVESYNHTSRKDGGNSYCFSFGDGYYESRKTIPAATALPVRCVEDEDYQSEDGVEKPANCHICKTNGQVIFPMVVGNTFKPLSDIYKVEVLWVSASNRSPKTRDIIKSIRWSSDRMCVEAGDTEGNAVIVAKNMDGEIIWSWHIWVTDENIHEQALAMETDRFLVMDRNLGAVDTEGYGLYYQWGRKDPFPFAENAYPDVFDEIDIFNSAEGYSAGVDIATMNPNCFLIDSNMDSNTWAGSAQLKGNWATNKGVYDPCPPGWRVIAKIYNGISIPPAGQMISMSSGLSGTGEHCYVWCSVSGFYYYSSVGGLAVYTNSDNNYSYGRPVRCMKEY